MIPKIMRHHFARFVTVVGILVGLVVALAADLRAETPSPEPAPPPVACKTVADCWLDGDGHAIPRPKKHAKKPIPRGDCGSKLLWLRHRLSCEENVCVALRIGDKC